MKTYRIHRNLFVIKLCLFITFFYTNCSNNSIEVHFEPVFQINKDSINYIKIIKETNQFIIRDRNDFELILKTINSSYIDLVKFGSHDIIEIYNNNDSVIFNAYFKENKFKKDGIVYRSQYSLSTFTDKGYCIPIKEK